MSPKVHTPTKDVTAEIAGVAFTRGVGETDDEAALNYFRRHGYTIDAGEAPGDATPEGDPKSWTKEQLVKHAERAGIELGDAKTKPQILAAVLAATVPTNAPTPPAAPDDTTPATPVAGDTPPAS